MQIASFDPVTFMDHEGRTWQYVAGVEVWRCKDEPSRYLPAEDFAAVHSSAPRL